MKIAVRMKGAIMKIAVIGGIGLIGSSLFAGFVRMDMKRYQHHPTQVSTL